MARWSVVALLVFVACASSNPAPPPDPVDPMTEPTIIGAVEEAAIQGTAEAEQGARIGRRIGVAAGVIAALTGGPETESLDDMLDRYRDTRNAAQTAGAIIGGTHGAVEGAKRGFSLDLQFAELTQIAGIEATRPFPDLIDLRFTDRALLPDIANVLIGRDARLIEIEAAGDTALEVRNAFVELDAPGRFDLVRNDERMNIVIRIEY